MVLITRTRPSSPVKGESPYFPTKSAPASLRNVSPDPGPTEIPDHNGFSGPVELPGGSKPSILEEPEDSERPSGPVQSPDYEETIGEDQGEEEGNEGQGEQEQHGEEGKHQLHLLQLPLPLAYTKKSV